MKSVEQAQTLPSFKGLIKYAWSKIVNEVSRYWQDELPADKLLVSEDARLMIIAHVVVQARCHRVFPLLIALQDFVNDQIYEECAPLATFESAIRVIEYEYREKCLETDFSSLKQDQPHQPAPDSNKMLDLLRFSHTGSVIDGSFNFSKSVKASFGPDAVENRQTILHVHREDIANLQMKQNIRMSTMDNEDYLDLRHALTQSAVFATAMEDLLGDQELLPQPEMLIDLSEGPPRRTAKY